MFRDLHVVGTKSSSTYQPTLASTFSPWSLIEGIQEAMRPPLRDILTGFEGVIRPGEMLLVLGKPGAGCSTLLKVLANHRSEYHAINGEVNYDSISPEHIREHFRGDVQYCSEDDVHFPTLTVEQTIKFAAKTRSPCNRLMTNRDELVQLETDIFTTVLGLIHAKSTLVGDALIHGISGGEKKRVSIAEVLAGRSCVNAWDNSTRGLDSSTALELLRAFRVATDILKTTTIVTLYQAGESLYNQFDKVCLLYEGRMAYFGPADQARQYFIDLGYEPAHRQTTSDFLISVTDPNARLPRSDILSIPRNAAEFAEHFQKSRFSQVNKRDIQSYEDTFVGKPDRAAAYMNSAQSEHSRGARKESPYITSIAMQTRAVMLRRVQLMWGNKLETFMNMFGSVVQSAIIGTVFLKMADSTDTFFPRGSVLFCAVLLTSFASLAEIPALFSQRPVVSKHEKAALYHPFVEALAMTLVDIPITLVLTILYGVILYYMTGMQRTTARIELVNDFRFSTYYVIVFVSAVSMKNFFRATSAAVRSQSTALSIAGLTLVVVTLYSGYIVPKPSMVRGLKWIGHINPISYAFEALMANEFHTLKGMCTEVVPQGPGYDDVSLENKVCTVVGALPGQPFVDGSRFLSLVYEFSYSHVWRNFGIVLAFGTVFFISLLAFTEVNTATFSLASPVLFKRGGKWPARSHRLDEEAQTPAHGDSAAAPFDAGDREKAPLSTDIFSWKNLNYMIPVPGEAEKRLLDDISGYVAPGKLTALMGESGAGKTTLLNVLAQRADFGVVTGSMFVNGQVLPDGFQSQTGYCQQLDIHVPTTTVREALLFSAKLRRPQSVTLAENETYVERCIKLCGLEDYADAMVGTLNTEFRKRTTIAVELAAKPKLLLFLDEPTTGLDSQSAWAIVSFLRTLADHGQAVLCTIHQPSAELFQVFDRLLLLRKGGQTVYFGDVGHNATTVLSYFERNGGKRCLPDENPAEYILDIIGAGANATSKLDWYNVWRESSESLQLLNQIESIHDLGRQRPPSKTSFYSEFATSWGNQLKILIERDARSYWRDPTYLMAKLSLNAMGGLFVGLTFFRSEDTQQGTQDKVFAIFIATIISVALSTQIQIPFLAVRTIYEIRERKSRIYSWTALITSQILIEIPWNILGSTIFFCCWYWTVGFSTSRAGYSYLMVGILWPLHYSTIGQAVAAMCPNPQISSLLFATIYLAFIVTFDGVLQPFRRLGWWKWMYHVSPYTYLIEGFIGQAVGHQTIQCSPIEFVLINPPPNTTCSSYLTPFLSYSDGYLTNPNATEGCQFCGISSTDKLLKDHWNINYDNRWRNVGIMVWFVVFDIICIYAFTYLFRIHKTRRRGRLSSSTTSKTNK
ncbi:pleiotropic drug resistance ABC transporter [Pluteus cervinus]|uniref:Pleiotropic drug resistance ABC transporter n=1 Tax=Pluteus cervinus TaxID=181527 RepID=A0ACD3B282_9AGAR|nr:pleiotropic drug resistance ABC transporter [Pluteus cervinus]